MNLTNCFRIAVCLHYWLIHVLVGLTAWFVYKVVTWYMLLKPTLLTSSLNNERCCDSIPTNSQAIVVAAVISAGVVILSAYIISRFFKPSTVTPKSFSVIASKELAKELKECESNLAPIVEALSKEHLNIIIEDDKVIIGGVTLQKRKETKII